MLNEYNFKYVEAYFLEPDISNPDDLYKLLTIANNAGGLTPNKAKQIVYEAYGEVAENYQGEWGDVPLAYSMSQNSGAEQASMSLQKQIEKAYKNNDDEVVAVMKEVRSLLLKQGKAFTESLGNGTIKKEWEEDLHPRDENGRFSGGCGSNEHNSAGNSKPYEKPTLKLSKKEYGKVMHSINNVYYSRFKGKEKGYIAIGKNTYRFEIRDFNEYNIYSKGER